jgi:hypothetical protein
MFVNIFDDRGTRGFINMDPKFNNEDFFRLIHLII